METTGAEENGEYISDSGGAEGANREGTATGMLCSELDEGQALKVDTGGFKR